MESENNAPVTKLYTVMERMRIAIPTMLLRAMAAMDRCFALIWYKRGKERPQISLYQIS